MTTIITIKGGTTYVSSTDPFISTGNDMFPNAEQLTYDTWCVPSDTYDPAADLLHLGDERARGIH